MINERGQFGNPVQKASLFVNVLETTVVQIHQRKELIQTQINLLKNEFMFALEFKIYKMNLLNSNYSFLKREPQ